MFGEFIGVRFDMFMHGGGGGGGVGFKLRGICVYFFHLMKTIVC